MAWAFWPGSVQFQEPLQFSHAAVGGKGIAGAAQCHPGADAGLLQRAGEPLSHAAGGDAVLRHQQGARPAHRVQHRSGIQRCNDVQLYNFRLYAPLLQQPYAAVNGRH